MNMLRRKTPIRPINALQDVQRRSSEEPGYAEWVSRVRKADITGCIAFSKLRCFLSLASLVLLASDIPRTGLGMRSLSQYYTTQLAPGSAIFFGPFAYPVLHIACNNNGENEEAPNCIGSKGTKPVTQVPTWPYAFDTTSIGLRGAAKLFNASSFPVFLMGRGSDPRRGDPRSSMDLHTAFTMMDGLVNAIQGWQHPGSRSSNVGELVYERFATEHKWVDRLHQFLLRPIIANLRWRVHSVNFFAKRSRVMDELLDICSPTTPGAFSMPMWCSDYMKWRPADFANMAAKGVSIGEHIEQRSRTLQEAYPDLWLDVTVVSTLQPLTTASVTYSTFFQNFGWEVVVIFRGRECRPDRVNCSTKWVDDYRYERVSITTNVAEWYVIAAALRGAAQVYVWIHLILLLYTCHSAAPPRLPNLRHTCSKLRELAAALSTMLKIPFQVVVYGSHVPILLYVFAQLIDGKFTDSYLDSYWSTVGGVNHECSAVNFIQTASVQMRNVWVLALLAKLRTYFATRGSSWQPQHGILGVQGLAISFTSFLSIFGPYKSKTFRDTSITSVALLTQSGPGHSTRVSEILAEPAPWFNSKTFELGDSLSMTLLTLISVLGLHVVFVGLSKLLCCPTLRRIFFRYSLVVPSTVGPIFPTTALAVCFRVYIKHPRDGLRLSQIEPATEGAEVSSVNRLGLLFERREPSQSHVTDPGEASNEHISEHEWELNSAERTQTTTSVIQLMNVAMMSDPWTLFRLRVLGIELFVYSVCSAAFSEDANNEPRSAVLLPFGPTVIASRIDFKAHQYEFICRVDSRDLPLWVLLHCG